MNIPRKNIPKGKSYLDYAQEAILRKTLNREEREALQRGVKLWKNKTRCELEKLEIHI